VPYGTCGRVGETGTNKTASGNGQSINQPTNRALGAAAQQELGGPVVRSVQAVLLAPFVAQEEHKRHEQHGEVQEPAGAPAE
jgi:hypothetical protein